MTLTRDITSIGRDRTLAIVEEDPSRKKRYSISRSHRESPSELWLRSVFGIAFVDDMNDLR